ncbi:TRAUB-domain-containing protein [Aspergillus campestris IBT 28561]|uniref:Protein BFR2 n=1 Tax=Aspergillus campestris (strain IBT 28561) TaxID=1392248 RepID=A0A2I1CZF2_ASPC2|nr:TRAUB-domain-containing protein [Aspergillus campestris IBT 28561]PKY03004.1 TRAUB-domain-containing protein [Aspergillus campestris IBT 28561]
MAPKSLAEQIAELDDPTPKDFDPEDLEQGAQDSSDEEGGQDADASAGREHYQAVGKGKLRKQDPINLGKQYAGSKVSRDALEAESDDDPFAARSSDDDDDASDDDEDEEGSGSDEEDVSDEEEVMEKKRSKGVQKKGKSNAREDMETDGSDDESEGFSGEDDEDMEIPSDEDDDEDDDEEDEDEEDEDEDEDEDEPPKRKSSSDDREELRKLMASDQKSIAATISQATKADAVKGKAVKQQRATFDALLNSRIKLQKGLAAINQLSGTTKNADEVDGEAVKSAESAALTLWSTLEDLRVALADAHTPGEKRKRASPATPSTSSASLWKRMTDLEASSLSHRRTVLDKWSHKVRGSNATIPNTRGKLLGASAAGQQNVSAVLDAYVATETGDRAAKRARKSAASDSANADDEPIYDDTIFYQSLLRELVEQRLSSSDAITNGIDTLHIQLPSRAVHHVTGMRKDKIKRDIDTRASKGRKMRFDVHEKLQNFMAPEDRTSWTGHSRNEFFASLLGRTASGLLGEGDDEEASSGGEESEEDMEEGGLRLFRS